MSAKNILLTFLILYSYCYKAQIISGDSSSNVYYNNIADFNISGTPSYLDIDNDGINDVKFYTYTPSNLCMFCSEYLVYAENLTNLEFVVSQLAGIGLDTISHDSLIDNKRYWNGSNNSYVFTHYEYIGPPPSAQTYYYGLYWGAKDKYMGFRINYQNDTIYGWILIGGNASKVKSYAIEKSVMGINKIENQNNINIYPNPVNSNLQIAVNNHLVGYIKLYDILGKEIISTTEKNIDVSNLQEGIYFVQVKTSEGILKKKIIIKH